MAPYVVGHKCVHREAIPRKANCGSRHITKTHGAVLLQGSDPGIGSGWHYCAKETRGYFARMVFHEVVGRHRARPGSETIYIDDSLLLGPIDQYGGNAGKVDPIGLEHFDCHARGYACINRVAPGFKNCKSGVCRSVMTGRNHVARASNEWTINRHRSPCVVGRYP